MQHEQEKVGGTKKRVMYVVSGETTSKVKALQGYDYAALVTTSLFVRYGHIYGLAFTSNGKQVGFKMPLHVFKEVSIQYV